MHAEQPRVETAQPREINPSSPLKPATIRPNACSLIAGDSPQSPPRTLPLEFSPGPKAHDKFENRVAGHDRAVSHATDDHSIARAVGIDRRCATRGIGS